MEALEREAAAGERPRTDYVELARVLRAEVVDHAYLMRRAAPFSRAVARRFDDPEAQAVEMLIRSRRFAPLVVWNEKVAFLLASLFKLARSRRDLVVISVAMSTPRRALLQKKLRVHAHMAAIVTYGTAQYETAVGELGVPSEKLHVLLPKVDERFWRPAATSPDDAFCSVGWEARDYETLVHAVRGLTIEARIVVGSSVRVRADPLSNRIVANAPPNLRVHHDVAPRRLRDLYARSRFVVIPLHDVDYDAGGTAVTEAMAMGKAVILTRTRGQVDLVEDGEQGLYVPPGDPSALRSAIERLLEHPDEAERMGRAGRKTVEKRHTLDAYIARLADVVRAAET